MALWWSIEKVADVAALQNPEDRVLTEALVWATMSVGYQVISGKNKAEFLARIRECEKAGFYFYGVAGVDTPIPAEAIDRRVGLVTNAGTFSRAEMRQRLKAWQARQAA